jgi:two-component system KDP operon response regulator KdpE
VLIASDDAPLASSWMNHLRQRDIAAILARSADEAIDQWAEQIPDLIAIDINSHPLEGIELCRSLRSEAVIPLLVTIPFDNEVQLLAAYQAGADEVIVRPVSPALFLAKVTAWLRRSWTVPAESLASLKVGDLYLVTTRREVITPAGKRVRLTNLEFRLLYLLMSNPDWTLSVDDILQRVWGHCEYGSGVILKNVIYRLRKKIEPDPSHPQHILTEAGLGYQFRGS